MNNKINKKTDIIYTNKNNNENIFFDNNFIIVFVIYK